MDQTNDDNPVLVGKVQDLFCIRIVGRAVGVGPHPFDQIVVSEKCPS